MFEYLSNVGLNLDSSQVRLTQIIKILTQYQWLKFWIHLHRFNFHLPDNFFHYWFRASIIFDIGNYIPSLYDILYIRAPTSGITQQYIMYHNKSINIVDVGGQRNERRKWVHCFDHVNIVLFVVSLGDYDQVLEEDSCVNSMVESLHCFSGICNSKSFVNIPIVLFLNKYDIFQEKLQHISLDCAFPNYSKEIEVRDKEHINNRDNPDNHNYNNHAKLAAEYIMKQFLNCNLRQNKQIYSHIGSAVRHDEIESILKIICEIIVDKSINEINISL